MTSDAERSSSGYENTLLFLLFTDVLLGIVAFIFFVFTPETKKVKLWSSNKFFNSFLILLGLIFLVYVFNLPVPFRYKITGTNKGIIYKTDRFTGRTWIVTPSGEELINVLPKKDEQKLFPLGSLEVLDVGVNNQGFVGTRTIDIYGSIKNHNGQDAACNIAIKVVFKKNENSGEVDTQTANISKAVYPNDTIEFSERFLIPQQLSGVKFWYNVYVISANICL